MLRPAIRATILTVAALVLSTVQVMAATPTPPPGSVRVQPISTSAGIPSQSGGTASLSTGQAWAGSNSQDAAAAHCGVNATAGPASQSAQSQQLSTSGSSSPDCSGPSSQPAQGRQGDQGSSGVSGGVQKSAGSSSAANGAGAAGATQLTLKPAASVSGFARVAQWFGWLFLLLLLAALFLLLGVVIGRRRREPVAA